MNQGSQMHFGDAAEQAVTIARRLGADEVKAWGSRSTHAELSQREGRVEKTSEATTQGLSISLLVDERFSSHATSDLRPEALEGFIARAIEATGYLEPDPERRMLAREAMGAADDAGLELADPGFDGVDPALRHKRVAELEALVMAKDPGDLVSTTAFVWAVRSETRVVFSNGFDAYAAGTSFGLGAEATISEPGGKLPESYAYFSARHREDVPETKFVADTLWSRLDAIRDAGPCESGRYPMLLDARAVGRVLSSVLGPLSGGTIWQGRSMYQDKLGERIAAEGFTLLSDPFIPRGLGSHTFDGDGMPATRRTIIEDGVLQTFLLDVYHARKLERAPNGGRLGNIIVPPGTRSPEEMAAAMPRAIRVTSFLGGNANSTTGDFSFGVRGELLENGEVVKNLTEMNISGNLADLMGRYVEAANDPWPWSSYRVPTLLFDGVQFSGT